MLCQHGRQELSKNRVLPLNQTFPTIPFLPKVINNNLHCPQHLLMIYYYTGSIMFSYTQHFSSQVELITNDSQARRIFFSNPLQTMAHCFPPPTWSKILPPFSSFHNLLSFITIALNESGKPIEKASETFDSEPLSAKNTWTLFEKLSPSFSLHGQRTSPWGSLSPPMSIRYEELWCFRDDWGNLRFI